MSKWVTAWGTPVSFVGEGIGNYVADTTFRQMFYTPISAKKIKLRFSNEYGKTDVKLDKVVFAEYAENTAAILNGTKRVVTFNDNGNVIKSGSSLLSDEIEFEVEACKNYVVSFYIKDFTPLDTGYNRFAGDKMFPCWIARGDLADEERFPANNRNEVFSTPFFCGVDVETGDNVRSIMAFGDSITARPWPDLLARRINGEGMTDCSVVRKAIGGNRILRDYRNNLARRRMGVAAIDRFETSIEQVLGVETVIMLEGINDIMHPHPDSPFSDMSELPTASELIEGYKKCIDIAHGKGAKMYLCTILPCERMLTYIGDREKLRQEVNEWIRTNDYADGYVDFDKAVADEEQPTKLKAEYNSGDDLHPSQQGSQALCDAIPEYIYKK